MDRRDFIETTSYALAGLAALGPPRPRLRPVGLQLYTVRREMARDVARTLAGVAAIGYEEVEFAGYFDLAPSAVRDFLAASGLTAPSTHVGLDVVETALDPLLERSAVVGHRFVVVPSLPRGRRQTLDDYRRIAESFNRAGERCRTAAVRFAYHNHAFEFEPIDGRLPFDVLLEECDASLVEFQMDLFWVVRGGGRPVDYFRRFPGRFPMVHVKDMAGVPDGEMVDVGQGDIDFAEILRHRGVAGLQHYFVEHDNPADPIASITTSYHYLRQLTP